MASESPPETPIRCASPVVEVSGGNSHADLQTLSPAPLRTRLKRLLGSRGVLAILDQGVVSAASLLTVLAVGRALSQEALGIYHLSIGCFFLVQSVAEQTIHLPYLIRRGALKELELRALTGSILVHTAGLVAAAMVALGGLAAWMAATGSRELAGCLAVLTCVLPLMIARDFVHNLLHSRLEQRRAFEFDLGVFAVQILLLALLYGFGGLSVARVLVVIAVACGVTAMPWLVRHRQWFFVRSNRVRSHARANWRIGRWALGSYLVGSGSPVILPWILVATHGISATGRLAACMTLVGLAQMFLRGTAKYLSPASAVAYTEGGAASLIHILRKFALLYAATMTPLALFIGLFGQRILEVCFGETYTDIGPAMLLLAIGFWLQSFDMVVGNGLYAMSRSDANFWADCIRCVATIIASAILIPMAGVSGVAAALLAGGVAGIFARSALLAARFTLPEGV